MEPVSGRYQALETTRLYSKAVLCMVRNAQVPLSQFDDTARKIVDQAGIGLPTESSSVSHDDLSVWDKLKYRLAMNTTRNSIGRQLINGTIMSDPGPIVTSGNARAYRDCVRIYIASQIYRRLHGGNLPHTITDFNSILGSWPKDPFNGLPMIYRPLKHSVYSVGNDLNDDGGLISDTITLSKDIGVKL